VSTDRVTDYGEKIKTEWLFVYYMPYDNNLSKYGDEIINMIGDSILSENVVATVQAEIKGVPGMSRYIINNTGITVTTIKNERSASVNTYREYLEWVQRRVDYEKLAVIFLDHGGKLDEICLDERPVSEFLKIDEIKTALYNTFGKNAIDLLFLQVCTKGVIEALYEFKDTAKYTLCSQIELGAPNRYYQGLFSVFSERTVSSGRDVAELIVGNEANKMYNSYTLIDNSKMDGLFSLFSEFVNQIKDERISVSERPLDSFYFRERYWDVLSFLENISYSGNKTLLMDFIVNELIILHQISPEPVNGMAQAAMSEYSGLSISGVKNEKYNKLEFYRLLKPIRDLY
jgi:hypothetical protein